MYIYVASSWRNPWQPAVVEFLRSSEMGHQRVYDFRNPAPGDDGFSWREVDPTWQRWTPERYRKGLAHPVAEAGFKSDRDALAFCELCVLVQPCGRSAHLELGWAAGCGKRTAVLYPRGFELTAIGGHSVSTRPCGMCGDLDGCHLPGKLGQVEPELMVKLCDGGVLLGKDELAAWVRGHEKRHDGKRVRGPWARQVQETFR